MTRPSTRRRNRAHAQRAAQHAALQTEEAAAASMRHSAAVEACSEGIRLAQLRVFVADPPALYTQYTDQDRRHRESLKFRSRWIEADERIRESTNEREHVDALELVFTFSDAEPDGVNWEMLLKRYAYTLMSRRRARKVWRVSCFGAKIASQRAKIDKLRAAARSDMFSRSVVDAGLVSTHVELTVESTSATRVARKNADEFDRQVEKARLALQSGRAAFTTDRQFIKALTYLLASGLDRTPAEETFFAAVETREAVFQMLNEMGLEHRPSQAQQRRWMFGPGSTAPLHFGGLSSTTLSYHRLPHCL